MENSSILRQADNKVFMTGILKKKDLEEKKDSNGNDIITGTLTIQTGEYDAHNVRIYIGKTTNPKDPTKDKPNPAWPGMKTIMETWTSMAMLAERGATKEEQLAGATKVRLGSRANLRLNEFYD